MKTIENNGEDFAARMLTQTAQTIHHLIKVDQKETGVETITATLKTSIENANNGKPNDMCDKMIAHAHVLDAAFYRYIKDAHQYYDPLRTVGFAMKLQNQMLRTTQAWQRLKNQSSAKTQGTN